MELKEFITASLLSIKEGIAAANQEGAAHFSLPQIYETKKQEGIRFDVAVTSSNESGSEKAAGIRVYGVGMGGETSSSELNQTVSRIMFQVSIDETLR